MPKISVILPVYNCEKFIVETIQSVLQQTYTDFELIIIDDCSTDNTINLIEQFKDARIKLIIKEKNTGYTDSLNYAVSIVKGQYIARMDGDDICLPTRFEKQVAFLEANPKVILCGTAIQLIGTKTVLKHPLKQEEIKVKLCFGTSFYHPTVMGKKESFLSNPYDKTFEPAEDYELWTRLAFQGKLANLDEVLLLYRVHDNQVSNSRMEIQKEKSFLIKKRMFSKLVSSEMINSTKFKVFLGLLPVKSIQDCREIVEVSKIVLDQNKRKIILDEVLFANKILKHKNSLLKSYITKSTFYKGETMWFLLKYVSIQDFFQIFDLKKITIFK